MTASQPALSAELLRLAQAQDVPGFIDGVLALLARTTSARIVYMALGPGAKTRDPTWQRSTPPGVESEVLAALSTGVIQHALEAGETVLTTHAATDPRFSDRASVRRGDIQAVLCVPIGTIGVIYLQDRQPKGIFTEEERALVAGAADLLAPLSEMLVRHARLDAPDPTTVFRHQLECSELVGTSRSLADVLERIVVSAKTTLPILLTGPTGTGKSTIARTLHQNSGRRGPFITVDCTHLSGERLIADLFGARAGAYTGITQDRAGLVDEARGGTLFFDEVGELSLEAQAQLLRFAQDHTYRWLGDSRERKADDVRLVAATHVDLEAAVASGTFRSDLFFRLSAFPIEVPGLSDRLADLPYLAHDLVIRAAAGIGVPAIPLGESALAHLEARSWPGHVRELDNVLRAGLLWAHAESASALKAHHLDRSAPTPEPEPESLTAAVRAFKRRRVLRALGEERGNKTRAAERLGIRRSSLYELMASLGLET